MMTQLSPQFDLMLELLNQKIGSLSQIEVEEVLVKRKLTPQLKWSVSTPEKISSEVSSPVKSPSSRIWKPTVEGEQWVRKLQEVQQQLVSLESTDSMGRNVLLLRLKESLNSLQKGLRKRFISPPGPRSAHQRSLSLALLPHTHKISVPKAPRKKVILSKITFAQQLNSSQISPKSTLTALRQELAELENQLLHQIQNTIHS